MNADRDTERTALAVKIRPAKAADLDFLEQQFSPNNRSRYQHRRFAVQKNGEGAFLIAWHGSTPVGHFLLRWDGPEHDPSSLYPPHTPCLEAGGTREEYRRQGVATRIITEAERLARVRGYRQIGLAVGSTDNPLAKRLYERLGYADWGKGEFEISWDYETTDGRKGRESEVCIYMFKAL
ncbi:MAG: GNAT family N-acetyltransferase [Thermomicrobiales bacterium]